MTPENKKTDFRLAALIRFSIAITILNIAGYSFLGFEHSWAHMLVALLAAYSLELLMEWLQSKTDGRKARFLGSVMDFIYFLLPAHITALAVSMLLFTNMRLMPVVFAVALAIISKYIFRATIRGRSRHFFNPSNFGIGVILILFPWVGIAPPYQFSENFSGAPDWIFPAFLIVIGSFLNWKYTRKMPLILAWLGAFFLQALVRNLLFGTPVASGLVPMTGLAFLLFTFYMISDPGTTPFSRKGQIWFGLSVGLVYGLLMLNHIVFGLFFALLIVCTVRGLYLIWENYRSTIFQRQAVPSVESLEIVPNLKVAEEPAGEMINQ